MIAKIAEDIKSDKLQLPDASLESDDDWVALWSLVDSGSSVNVGNVAKVFPGAKIKRAPSRARPFKTTNGGSVPNLCSAEVDARTAEGEDIAIVRSHADVEMQIPSANRLSQGGKGIWYHENGGPIIDHSKCTQSDLIEAGGV